MKSPWPLLLALTVASILIISTGSKLTVSAYPLGLTRTAVFAGGCFWCIEAQFQRLRGVLGGKSGYAGGHTSNPTY